MYRYLKTAGGTWYARNGGHYDILFFLPELLRDRAKFRCQQARIISVDVGECSLRDSVKILPVSAKELGKALGLPKLERCGNLNHVEPCEACEAGYRNAKDDADTRTYLARDVEIEREGLMRARVLMGVDELPMTIAAHGIDAVKEAGHDALCTWDDVVREMAFGPGAMVRALDLSERWRPWMAGGRVEVFDTSLYRVAYGADIHSSYTRSVFDGLPGRPKRNGEMGLYRALVTVPEMDVPPLPYRIEGRLYFPTGKWEGHYCEPELEEAESAGCKVELLARYGFERDMSASVLAREWWDKRENATGFERLFWKCVLNWTWGKFGEHPEHEEMMVGDEAESGWRIYNATHGIFRRDTLSVPRLAHCAAAAWIPSHARVRLRRGLVATPKRIYCDTDCVWAPKKPRVEYGKGCGQWGLEEWKDGGRVRYDHPDAMFPAPKVYAAGPKARAKGFAGVGGFARRANRSHIEALARGEPLELFGLVKLRGRIKKGGDSLPLISSMEKSIRFEDNVPKRPPGRAWSVKELQKIL